MTNEERPTKIAARLNVKLASDVKPNQTEDVLASTPGVISIIQTFPGEKDEELSRMCVIEVDPAKSKDALKHLQDNPAVEYAEKTARRK